MATSRLLPLVLLLASGCAWSREAALPGNCLTAGTQAPIADLKAALAANGSDMPARFKLADAWSDAGCFSDALQVLEAGQAHNARNTELDARIRVARSVLSEQSYFDRLDDAQQDAKLSRAVLRCSKLQELASCDDALNMKPNDPTLLMAKADTLMQLKRSGEAIGVYRRIPATAVNHEAVGGKVAAAEALRRVQLDTCENKASEAAAHACELAWLPGASDELSASTGRMKAQPGSANAKKELRIAQQSARHSKQDSRPPAAAKPVPIIEERHEAVASNANSRYSNDAPATRSN